MSFAYLPWYTGDYLRDTRHLTPLKHGVYLLLLAYCWDARGPLPLDEQDCAGIANCRSADEVEALRYILERYFVKMDDGHYNRRIQKEIERACNISAIRSKAGILGYQAKAKQLLSKSQASASRLGQAIQGKVITTRSDASVSVVPLSQDSISHSERRAARASRLPDDWKLPETWKTWALACQPSWGEGQVNLAAAQFRDYWIAKAGKDGAKLDWLATWRNWIRREAPLKVQAARPIATAKFQD